MGATRYRFHNTMVGAFSFYMFITDRNTQLKWTITSFQGFLMQMSSKPSQVVGGVRAKNIQVHSHSTKQQDKTTKIYCKNAI